MNCTANHVHLTPRYTPSKARFSKEYEATSFSSCRIKIVIKIKNQSIIQQRKKSRARAHACVRACVRALRVCVCFREDPYILSRYRARSVSFAYVIRAIVAVAEKDKKVKGSRVRSGVGGRGGAGYRPILLPQVHLAHLRDGGGIIRPEKCIMHARGTARRAAYR